MRILCFCLSILLGFLLLTASASVDAGTINVTVANDEDRAAGDVPAGAGCSLREAIILHLNNNGLPYKQCTISGYMAGTPDTITFGVSGTITVNSSDNGIFHGAYGDIGFSFNPNALNIDGAGQTVVLSCNNSHIFFLKGGKTLALSNLAFNNCTAPGGGIAINSSTSGGGDLSLTNVSFTNINSNDGGDGGAINHAGESLSMTNVNFTNCDVGDGVAGNELGNGGAVIISGVSNPDAVSLTDVTFTNNSAENRGGALHITLNDSLGHSISLVNTIFTLNVANGSDSEDGGGAIWMQTDTDLPPSPPDIFSIISAQFLNNSAPNGQGGAILVSGGQLAYIITPIGPAAGGIFASNFFNNSAGGDATVDLTGGSGGAIYARGNLTAVQSSFINNTSSNGSGGAIALNNLATFRGLSLGNVTFNGNMADQAGGAVANIKDNGAMDITNVTISGNTATGDTTAGNTEFGGGAIYNANDNANPSFTRVLVRNSIFSTSGGGVAGGGNCGGTTFNNLGNNLQFPNTDTECSGATLGDPNLAAASVSPGPNIFVLTMAINGDHSPAQGTGDQPTCDAAPILNFDATGVPLKRPSPAGESCDIGAYESTTAFPVMLQSFSIE